MSELSKRIKEPNFILDADQVVVAIGVGIALALDMTGIWGGIPWLHQNLSSLTLIAVCLLIVSSFLERRITLEALREAIDKNLELVLLRQEKISKQLRSFPDAGIKLENRSDHKGSFESRFIHAQCVDISGLNLVGVAANLAGFFQTRAQAGCKIRLLMADPDSPAIKTAAGLTDPDTKKRELHNSIMKLEPLIETGNVEIRLLAITPPFSLLMIDPDQFHGEIQVELFVYKVPSTERPHFILTQTKDKRWYDFFRDQFELSWNNARPHHILSRQKAT